MKTKLNLFLFLMLFTFNNNIYAENDENGVSDPSNNGGIDDKEPHRARGRYVFFNVEQNGYTLYFDQYCYGCDMEMTNDNGDVYHFVIDEEDGFVEIPEECSGMYLISVFVGEKRFTKYIIL